MQNIQNQEAIKHAYELLLGILQGAEHEGVSLVSDGSCNYVFANEPNKSCIVGCMMENEFRKSLVHKEFYNIDRKKSQNANGSGIMALFDAKVIKVENIKPEFRVIDPEDMRTMQGYFDDGKPVSLKEFIQKKIGENT